jgi:hypothetical protein
MATTNLRDRLPLPRRKTCLLPLFLLFIPIAGAFSQAKNNPLYDYNKQIHFGFTVGTNIAGLNYELSDEFRRNDTLLGIEKQQFPGITLGAIANLHLGDHFDLRFLPTLALSERAVKYQFKDEPTVQKNIESVLIEAPLTVKFKSVRHRNTRFYVIAGGKLSYDMASEASKEQNPFEPFLALEPRSFYYEFGFGFDFYFPFFKFSPEIKVSRGLTNILSEDRFVFSESFSSLKSSMIFISFHFE